MISTQLLDSAQGCPAARVPVDLDLFITGRGWHQVGHGLTNNEGRVDSFGAPAAAGVYRIVFDLAAYLPDAFFPSVAITFEVRDPEDHYHLPVVFSPFGYSVYRA